MTLSVHAGFAEAQGESLLAVPGGDERLMAVLAAAAPFPERVSGEFFVPVAGRGPRQASERTKRWLKAAVGDDEDAKRALLQHRRRSGRDLGAGLIDVRLADPRRLPDWGYALVDFLLAQPPTAAADPASGRPGSPFVAFRRAVNRLVDIKDGKVRGVPVTPEACEDLAGQLIERLTQVCFSGFAFEAQLNGTANDVSAWLQSPGLDVSQSGWLDRLETLPGLAYVMGVVCLQWRRVVHELFDRLNADLPELRRTLWGWTAPGPVTGYSGDSGDPHNHGRVVTLLTFASGERVVYKPKDLRSVVGLMDVCTLLNNHGLPLPLHTRAVVLRDGYGWEEYVTSEPAAGEDGVRRYYTRLGMLARLAQFLECRDLWADNLVAKGDTPVFIDLENVLQARISKPALIGDRIRSLWGKVEETVAKTAVISFPRVIAGGVQAQDIGCMAGLQEQVALNSTGYPLGWEAPPYRPTWGAGELADPSRYADEVAEGYRLMQDCLLRNRTLLADARGPLALLQDAPVRYIWRSTWDCVELLGMSLSPGALIDGMAREVTLAHLFRSARETLRRDPGREDILEIVEQEIDAFRRMDVPLFVSRPGSDSVFTPDGVEIPGHFSGTAWQRLQDRVADLAGFPVDEHLAVLETCLDFTGARELPASFPGPGPRPRTIREIGQYVYDLSGRRAEPEAEVLLARAGELAGEVLDAAVPLPGPAGERSGWIGVVTYPAHGLDQIEPLQGDLLTGTAGLAVFLAELYANTGAPGHWTAAQDALDASAEFAALSTRSTVYRRMCGTLAPVGAFVGLGSAIYALSRCGHTLGDTRLVERAAALVPLAEEQLSLPTSAEPVLGRAGLLLALHKLREASPVTVPAAEALVVRLHEELLAELGATGASPYPPGLAALDGVPTGQDGLVWALAVSAAALGSASAPLLAHRFALDTPGSLLAAVATAHLLTGEVPGDLRERVARYCAADAARSCARLVVDTEVALHTARLTGDSALERAAGGLAAELLRRRDHTGRWFADRRRADRLSLSATDGLAAAGLTLLRLADDQVASLRLVH
ncbi:type 2 lantibiotic biosynthesis protein LanM [Nonomuraea solani]|uniref:Type 2 lantibiotic biosynthesis protein LanM n=1 Tax=Nonomuraea solani TaxID=1144553 RepID=A0A1H6EW28_9ACTN|nr:type 2 lanthipeptide synthetase LanM [Nonomuraea solani]SEH02057.1 type 2 lantibiotic biosynthesis protein LanM [Nonomuraea solani]